MYYMYNLSALVHNVLYNYGDVDHDEVYNYTAMV